MLGASKADTGCTWPRVWSYSASSSFGGLHGQVVLAVVLPLVLVVALVAALALAVIPLVVFVVLAVLVERDSCWAVTAVAKAAGGRRQGVMWRQG